jgi:UDP-glucose 4-epimerase
VPYKVAPRRAGDVAQLVADIAEARRVLDWVPSRSSIRQIVADAAALR